ncbi:MAG: hypothetical protein KAH72_01675, partial [Flavobacteriaceae bacterium]|nr:hypothetical protein [Flavobacteriaceae bacterium]
NKRIYHALNMVLPMQSNILHIANDYGQVDILLVSKYLDRKITTFIKDSTKYIIAKNCFTNTHRKVKYILDFQNLDFQKFDTLLLTDANSMEYVTNLDLGQFENVVIVYNEKLVEKIRSLGYEIANKLDHVVVLKKSIH